MKIAIVVQGRFHAFDLGRGLLRRGHEVGLFTNYPKWAVARFGFPKDRVESFWAHGVLSRTDQWLHRKFRFPYCEAALHRVFGRWARAKLARGYWDVVHSWSGVSEEILRARPGKIHFLMRGSSHIQTQGRLLEEEERRVGVMLEKPSRWMVAREMREYELADRVVVLSSFAYRSFLEEGFPESRLRLLPLGVRLDHFRPSEELIEARCRRILSGDPLRVLYVGAISYRKGIWDLRQVIYSLGGDSFRFRLVGPLESSAASVVRSLPGWAEWVSKVPQHRLPEEYAWGDVFIFPTIEDGFPAVLSQAQASGLPILVTTNSSGPDIIREGENGWVLPIRSSEAFVERLWWCAEHRKELSEMVHRIYNDFQPRDWADVAVDFEAICKEALRVRQL